MDDKYEESTLPNIRKSLEQPRVKHTFFKVGTDMPTTALSTSDMNCGVTPIFSANTCVGQVEKNSNIDEWIDVFYTTINLIESSASRSVNGVASSLYSLMESG